MTIVQDYVNALKITKQIREAREAGMTVKVQAVKHVPVIRMGYWFGTMEGCLLKGELNKAVKAVFDEFDEETKHALTFTPNVGEFAERARFWKNALRYALPPDQYSVAMCSFLHWYIHCIKQRREAAV